MGQGCEREQGNIGKPLLISYFCTQNRENENQYRIKIQLNGNFCSEYFFD